MFAREADRGREEGPGRAPGHTAFPSNLDAANEGGETSSLAKQGLLKPYKTNCIVNAMGSGGMGQRIPQGFGLKWTLV